MKTRYTDSENTFHEEWINTLVNAIVNSTYDKLVSAIVNTNYDKSYFRIIEYGGHWFLYFYHVKDDMIPFRLPSDQRLQYVIFEAKSRDWKSNIKKTNEVKDNLIQSIDKTLEERNEEVEKYEDSKSKYYRIRKTC
jgi:hypothetical protein